MSGSQLPIRKLNVMSFALDGIHLIFIGPDVSWIEIIDGKSSKDVLPNVDDDLQGLDYSVVVINHPEFEFFSDEDILFTQAQWAKGALVSTKFTNQRIREHQLL